MKTRKKVRRAARRATTPTTAAVHLPVPVDVVELHFPEVVPPGAKVEVKGKSLYVRFTDWLVGTEAP